MKIKLFQWQSLSDGRSSNLTLFLIC